MALKTKDVKIALSEGNRDNGKTFRLTEMPADQAERWAIRATIAISHTDMTNAIPPEMLGAGWAALAYGAIQCLYKLKWEELEPLLDEMMTCLQFVGYHPDHPDRPIVRPLVKEDIEEVETRFFLRAQIIELHMGFSTAAILSKLMAADNTSSQNAQTSRRRSRRRASAA